MLVQLLRDQGGIEVVHGDTDGDSVVDKDDECPEVAGTVANNGCPEGPSEDEMKMITELSEVNLLLDLQRLLTDSQY